MFPFNVIKDNDNIPTEKTACILIWYKCTISRWKYSTVSSPTQHAALRQKALRGEAPVDSSSLPPAPRTFTEEATASASHGAVHLTARA